MSDFFVMTAFDCQNRAVLGVGLRGIKRAAQFGGRAYQRSGKYLAAYLVSIPDASAA
jgi:hypothetical protein